MALLPASDQHKEIAELQERLQTLRQSVEEMEDLLARYIHTEELLRQSEEQFRLLVMSVRDYAIFMLDNKGYIASWNKGAQLIKGYTAEEIIGQHFSIFYPQEDLDARKPERELEIATSEGVYKEEGWRVRKDGSMFWASVVLTALHDHNGTLRGFGKVTRDLTERKFAEEAQQQLQQQEIKLAHEQAAREQAEANMRLRDVFLSSTAHELRTPVTSVLGYAQLLERRFSRGDLTIERMEKPVHAITVQSQRLDRLTTMLLDITRLENGKLTLDHVPFDLRQGISRVAQELQLLTEIHTIAINLPEYPLTVEGDELRFEQVMYNLIQNAIKYSPAGGAITVAAEVQQHHALVSVTDEGVGIPPEDIPQVFDRFYRATNIPHTNISGLGLGLYLVKDFVERQGGIVEAHSMVGHGTTFCVRLPIVKREA